MTKAPPNWYPDPSGKAELRWWDGGQWTEHTRPRGPLPQPRGNQGDGQGGSRLGLIAGGVLVAIAVALVVVVIVGGGDDDGGGGGGRNDEAEVRDTVRAVALSKDPAVCVKHTLSYLQKQTGLTGQEAIDVCLDLTPENDVTGVRIGDVRIRGSSAEARVRVEGGDYDGQALVVGLQRQDGLWRVNDLDRPAAARGAQARREIERAVLDFGSAAGAEACDYFSYSGLQRLGGRDECETRFAVGIPATYAIKDVTLSGASATVVVVESREAKTIEFRLSRELGEWEIDSFEQR